jgi:hypothetical protein
MSAEFSQIPSFPKNLAYNLKKLEGSIIKQKLKINADNSSYSAGNIIRMNIPVGRMIDTRSVVVYAKGTTTVAKTHFPRGGLHSLIEQLQITANGRNLQTTNSYNYIWNTLADLEGYSSLEQASKRITELADPSIRYTIDTTTAGNSNLKIVAAVGNADGTGADTDYIFCANNFLGFFNSSVSTFDTNNIGQVQVSFTLAPGSCLFASGHDTTAQTALTTAVAAASYTLKEVFMTLDSITYTNSMYYDLVQRQLEGDGLNIAYYDYISLPGTVVNKSSGINYSTQINASSLDQVIATFRPKTYDTIRPLVLFQSDTNGTTFAEYLANPQANCNKTGTSILNPDLGDGFNQSFYYIRAGSGINNSSWYINSQPFINQATPIEIFNNTLQALGYNNLDISAGGLHAGCSSLQHYNKYYFADVLSMENISGDGNWWVSGINGNGGTIQIQYQAKFDTWNSIGTSDVADVAPYIFARVSKILNVKFGRALDLYE